MTEREEKLKLNRNFVLCLVAVKPACSAILINLGRFHTDIVSGGAKFS